MHRTLALEDDQLFTMSSARDIFAVCFGLRQKCSKDSLHLEHFCRKASQTFGEKSLIVPNM
jgi:hypothetical protein